MGGEPFEPWDLEARSGLRPASYAHMRGVDGPGRWVREVATPEQASGRLMIEAQ